MSEWTQPALEAQGFVGFVPFEALGSLPPRAHGVYIVLRTSSTTPVFLTESAAAWRNGRAPSVDVDVLSKAWVAESCALYIGKATSLRSRLAQYRRHGAGKAGHWGGRYIWQLVDHAELLVAWMATPDRDPAVVEAELIAGFATAHGARPFANRNGGRRLPAAIDAAGL